MNCTDIEYIWQSRIHSGFTYKRKPGPFPDSAAIGLDFNVACERKTKLDLSLLTNGVVLDVYDFAKASVGSVRYLVADILEYNFDTGIENDKQRYVFTNRLFQKIGLIKKCYKHDEVFLLPDPTTFNLYGVSELLSRPCTNLSEFSVKSTLMSRMHEDGAATESVHAEQAGEIDHVDKATKHTVVKTLYPRCEAIGLDLYIRPFDTPKQKLNASFLTSQVIFEVLRFVRMVCGTHRQIVSDVLNYNFDLSAYERHVWKKVLRIGSTRNDFQLEARQAFRNKPCVFVKNDYQKREWRRRWVHDVDSEASASLAKHGKRKRKPKYDDVFCDFRHKTHDELKCLGPIDTEMDDLQETQMEQLPGTSVGLVHTSKDHQRPAVQVSGSSDERALPGRCSEYVSSAKKVTTEKLMLWRRRATRSEEIHARWFKDKVTCLDFNVGSGVRLNTDLQLLTNDMLKDLFKFACHMSRTQLKFYREIFQHNFILDPLDDVQSRFILYINAKIKYLSHHHLERSADFWNAVVVIPEAYRVVDVNGSPPAAEAVTQSSLTCLETSMEPYPFCKKLGINLWDVKERPLNVKLYLPLLTNGALLEVSKFTRKLCGTVCELMYDVLEHNFHFKLHGSKIVKLLQKWCRVQKLPIGSWSVAEQERFFDKIVHANPNSTEGHPPDGKGIHVSEMSAFNQPTEMLLADELKHKKSVHFDRYPLCKEMQINLELTSKREDSAKLDLQVLTRAVIYEIHRYLVENPQEDNYVPALYKILEDNFDLSSQLHRRCEFALAIASQVKTMLGNFRGSFTRKGGYPNKVFELPFEFPSSEQGVSKEEPVDGYWDLELDDHDDDIEFVCQFIPVDIEVMLD